NLSLQPEKSQSLSEALIREVRRVSNEAGAEFLLVFIPEKENTGGKPGYEGANDAAEGSNTYYSGYLEEFTSANAINYLDLLP
ncbi:MAG: hypothetical protein GWO24_18805, partial [Akkermansiaceae bacterium]|nr:hypothetical protein [Akkermansiaceae bacterium]